MSPKSSKASLSDTNTGYLVAGLVLAFSLFMGLFLQIGTVHGCSMNA